MVKIEAIIQPFKLEDVKTSLEALGIEGFIISEAVEHGPVAHRAFYRGAEYRVDVPKLKLEMLVSSHRADEVIEALARAASTTLPGGDDGTILVYELADAIRIRTRERLEYALR